MFELSRSDGLKSGSPLTRYFKDIGIAYTTLSALYSVIPPALSLLSHSFSQEAPPSPPLSEKTTQRIPNTPPASDQEIPHTSIPEGLHTANTANTEPSFSQEADFSQASTPTSAQMEELSSLTGAVAFLAFFGLIFYCTSKSESKKIIQNNYYFSSPQKSPEAALSFAPPAPPSSTDSDFPSGRDHSIPNWWD